MSKIQNNLDAGSLRAAGSIRERLEGFRSRFRLLEERERILITMYLDKGSSVSQISRLIGISESTICRRIEKILGRLTNKDFTAVLNHRDKLTKVQFEMACDYFVRGTSIRTLCVKYKMSYHKVWLFLHDIKKLR